MNEALSDIWRALVDWDQDRPRSFPLTSGRAQFYRGAMEVALVVFRPREPVNLAEGGLSALVPVLGRFRLELDTVEVDRNYKVNSRDTGAYIGRLQPDALKLHAPRILALGREAFDGIVTAYLGLMAA